MAATQNRPDPPAQDTPMHLPGRAAGQRSRIGGVWVALVAAAIVLLFLLIFVLQNSQRVKVSFLGLDWTLPMGVALLLAAVFGVLLVALPGTARIMQLRNSPGRRDPARADRLQPPQGTVEPPASGRPAGHRFQRW